MCGCCVRVILLTLSKVDGVEFGGVLVLSRGVLRLGFAEDCDDEGQNSWATSLLYMFINCPQPV